MATGLPREQLGSSIEFTHPFTSRSRARQELPPLSKPTPHGSSLRPPTVPSQSKYSVKPGITDSYIGNDYCLHFLITGCHPANFVRNGYQDIRRFEGYPKLQRLNQMKQDWVTEKSHGNGGGVKWDETNLASLVEVLDDAHVVDRQNLEKTREDTSVACLNSLKEIKKTLRDRPLSTLHTKARCKHETTFLKSVDYWQKIPKSLDSPVLGGLVKSSENLVPYTSPNCYSSRLSPLHEYKNKPETHFDVILIDTSSSANRHQSLTSLKNLPIRSLGRKPSFVFLWLQSPNDAEVAKALFEGWGYRRGENIAWIKTNKHQYSVELRPEELGTIGKKKWDSGFFGGGLKRDGKAPKRLLVRTVQHCVFGIKGTVVRDQDSDLIHCNVDTDVIFSEDSEKKPPLIQAIAENFALGCRRLHIFGSQSELRRGWVTVGNGIDRTTLDIQQYHGQLKQTGYFLGHHPEVEALRPKGPSVRTRCAPGGTRVHFQRNSHNNKRHSGRNSQIHSKQISEISTPLSKRRAIQQTVKVLTQTTGTEAQKARTWYLLFAGSPATTSPLQAHTLDYQSPRGRIGRPLTSLIHTYIHPTLQSSISA